MSGRLMRSVQRDSTRLRSGAGGFSVLELMVTVAVIAIIAGIATPSMSRLMMSNRLAAAGNEIVAGLNLARMEAVRRRVRVTMCPSVNGSACGGADWKRFIVRAADGTVLRDTSLSAGNYTVTSTAASLTFAATGFNTGANGRIAACSTRLPSDNQVVVDYGVSRISSARKTSANCAVGSP